MNAPLYPPLACHIGGEKLAGGGETLLTENPATGEALAQFDAADARTVDSAVAAAAAAQRQWLAMSPAERGRVLFKVAALLRARTDELAHLEVLDTGKPIQEAPEADIGSAADCFEFFAGLTQVIHGEHMPLSQDAFAYTRREPLGVCAGIGAWNYPIQIASWKAAPALAAGNAMVFKPSELTPMTALRLAEIVEEASAPKGLFNVVLGAGPTGAAMTAHPGIAKVSITGSVPTGRRIMAAAAETLKHVTMELGGKSALIVFADADLDDSVSAAMLANFYTQGEICSNGTRVFVHESIREEFLARLLARTQKIKIGDPLDPETQMGPLISAAHLEKVLGFVERARAAGAELLTGGARLTEGALAAGHFMAPTVFAATDEMEVVREEVFGPVMSVLSFAEEDEVVARANDTPYGLAAGLMTKDLARAHRVAASLQAGTVWINSYNLTPIAMPFGGVKQSGIGRENGLAALDFYTERKSVYVNLGKVEAPY
ncbi:betaine-aldehyde dehydrogenase [Afifella sp. IM 167]|uniref:betaine-aldehyde dehydrogenase n=1 Tax=Afifella sp. IM 167 TaxID=2033586 RepID=UPI00210479C1|nr:betaine-aldehyde dehydrogenase [Afifella sp. IM 167]MBZ8135250.1 betaine-aldehyde dehydrogenase [Afifella sp. IM 167]